MFNRLSALLLVLALPLAAQTPLENTGKPMRIAYDCAAPENRASALDCSDEAPCLVYLELSAVQAVGAKLFLAGNLHTPMVTLSSVLLVSEDGGKTWTEPHPRIPSSGLDQIQFVDFQTGWISGANLQTAPRDPFFLATTDGGKTWTKRPIFEDTRVAAIDSFRFETPAIGTVSIDATLDNGRHEEYRTENGGESWAAVKSGGGVKEKADVGSAWRVRTDAATHSYVIEKLENNRWQKVASFLVQIATCKE